MYDIIYVSPQLKRELEKLQRQLRYETIDDLLKELAKDITLKSANTGEKKEGK
jgi:hypothetical protein